MMRFVAVSFAFSIVLEFPNLKEIKKRIINIKHNFFLFDRYSEVWKAKA